MTYRVKWIKINLIWVNCVVYYVIILRENREDADMTYAVMLIGILALAFVAAAVIAAIIVGIIILFACKK